MCFPFQVRARSFEYARVWVCLVCVGGGGKMDTAEGREMEGRGQGGRKGGMHAGRDVWGGKENK